MPKAEYDSLIKRQHVSRIAFAAAEHPYLAPFMYVFDGKYLCFLSSTEHSDEHEAKQGARSGRERALRCERSD